MKSEKFFGIEPPARRKFTPSSTSMVCAHWRTLGPAWEADDELARSGIERIHRDSPRSWVRTPGGGWLFAKLCRLPQDRRRLLHHEGAGAPLGHPTRGSSALHVGLAFGYGPAFRRVAQCEGTTHRGPGSRASSSSVSTKEASHL